MESNKSEEVITCPSENESGKVHAEVEAAADNSVKAAADNSVEAEDTNATETKDPEVAGESSVATTENQNVMDVVAENGSVGEEARELSSNKGKHNVTYFKGYKYEHHSVHNGKEYKRCAE